MKDLFIVTKISQRRPWVLHECVEGVTGALLANKKVSGGAV